MPQKKFVTLYHSETGEPWECPVAAVDYWTKNGYRKTDPHKSGSTAGSTRQEG